MRASTTRRRAAVAAGKLLGLNEDQLANALSLALTMHVPLRVNRAGTLSMQKGCATADAARSAVFAALAAREGMTGPAEPFEGRDGLWDKITGPYRQLRLPPAPPNGTGLNNIIKRYPAEAYTLAVLQSVIPEVRKWTRVEDIAAIHVELNFVGWLEIADPPKWDPRNRETADHSLAYEIARALVDGEIWLDSFGPDKLMDPAVRGLMEKITASVNPDYSYHGQMRMTVRTKAGTELVRELGRNNTAHQPGHAGDARRDRRQVQSRVRVHARLERAARACVRAVVEPARRARHRRAHREPGAVRLSRRRSDLDWPDAARASLSCLRPASRHWPSLGPARDTAVLGPNARHAAFALGAWNLQLIVRARRSGRALSLQTVLKAQHYLQACAQGSVLVYWGWYWRPVYDSAHLIVAQLLFAYAFDMLLSWSRRGVYTLGFGPFPVIFSINLFLWFKPDWFFFQFLMVAVGFAAKELIRWDKDGRRAHIFNPSSFPLAVFSLALLLTRTDPTSPGAQEIATTQFYPPHMYLFSSSSACRASCSSASRR